MKTILLATKNERKIREAKAACEKFGIEVKQVKLDVDEIQSSDPHKISKQKAETAYSIVGQPVVVTDTYWNIPALNGFPGAYMKEVNEWLTPKDFLQLMKNKSDRRISFTESITYKDSKQTKVFSKEFWGLFLVNPRGSGNSIEQLAQFDGQTIAQRKDQGKLSHDPEDYIWFEFAEWYGGF